MTRKIIQVSAAGVDNNINTQCDVVFVALCDDGTVWTATNTHEEWSQMPAISQPAPPADPQAMPTKEQS